MQTFEQAATELGVTVRMIYYYITHGQLKTTTVRGFQYIPQEEIDALKVCRAGRQKRGAKAKIKQS